MAGKVLLGKLKLNNPIMNAAGPWAATASQLEALNNSNSGAVVTKTFTLKARTGNKKPNVYFDKNFSINNVGLENGGADYFLNTVANIKKTKPFIASIFESNTKSFIELAARVNDSNFDAIELNLSCPNIKSHSPIAYDLQSLEKLLDDLLSVIKLPVGVKMPPYVSETQIVETAKSLKEYPINHLVLINTFPLASTVVDGKSPLRSDNGIGGLGGSYLKPIAIAHVILFKKYLPIVPIIAVGGVQSKIDIDDFLTVGASAVQLGSALENAGVSALNKLSAQF